jgi:hypothetical protein
MNWSQSNWVDRCNRNGVVDPATIFCDMNIGQLFFVASLRGYQARHRCLRVLG